MELVAHHREQRRALGVRIRRPTTNARRSSPAGVGGDACIRDREAPRRLDQTGIHLADIDARVRARGARLSLGLATVAFNAYAIGGPWQRDVDPLAQPAECLLERRALCRRGMIARDASDGASSAGTAAGPSYRCLKGVAGSSCPSRAIFQGRSSGAMQAAVNSKTFVDA